MDGLDLFIEVGKVTVIIGQSGSGKSVLLKHIIGLIQPDKGKVEIDGQDISGFNERQLNEIRKRFGMLFQEAALFDSMTVGQNVAFPLIEHSKLPKSEIREIVSEKLAHVGLRGVEDQMPSELSGGMKKRVGLARAIALEPEIILFDEPTTGLDPIIADAIDQLIVDIQSRLILVYRILYSPLPQIAITEIRPRRSQQRINLHCLFKCGHRRIRISNLAITAAQIVQETAQCLYLI